NELPQALARLEQFAGDFRIVQLACAEQTRAWLQEQLVKEVQSDEADRTVVLAYQFDGFANLTGELINGLREQVGKLRAFFVLVREDARMDFQKACPDFMDWIGLNMLWVADVPVEWTLEDVKKSIQRLEDTHGISSVQFLENPDAIAEKDENHVWLWGELLTIRSEWEQAEQET
ncbi:MAG: hypothetical protein N2C14_11215, partial [Planctomycetales bacterium]